MSGREGTARDGRGGSGEGRGEGRGDVISPSYGRIQVQHGPLKT